MTTALASYSKRTVPHGYDSAWLTSELANLQNAVGRYPPMDGETGVTDSTYPVGDIRRYGARQTTGFDNATAFQRAVDFAVTLGKGAEVYVPPLPDGESWFLSSNPFLNQMGDLKDSGASVTVRVVGCSIRPSKQIAVPTNVIVAGTGRLASRIHAQSGFVARVNVSSASRTSNVTTITTASAHGLEVGATVVVESVTDTTFNGGWQVASVPTTTTFTYAQTASNATSSSGTVTIPVVALGDEAPSAFGCRLENIKVDCASITNSVGVYSNLINEQSGLVNVLVEAAYRIGVWVERSGSTASVTGPLNYTLRDIETIMVPDVGATGVKITGTYGQHRGIDGFTHTVVGASGTSPADRSAAALDISGAPGLYSRIHCEFCTNGIIIGSRAGASDGAGDSSGVAIVGVTGQGSVTTLVRIKSAAEVNAIMLAGLAKVSGTNILADEISSITLTDDYLGHYALHTSSSNGITRYSTSPSVDWRLGTTTETAGVKKAIVTKTAGYTLTAIDSTVKADATSGAITITLPAAASHTRRVYTIKKVDASANAVVVDANSAELIDGAATYSLTAQYDSVTVQCDGTGWHVIAAV